MVITLEEPFASLWRKGYLQTHPNNRQYVCLYNSQDDRTIISYARYLKSVQEGCLIDSELVVDHINDIEIDDRIDNFQAITPEQNRYKQYLKSQAENQNSILYVCECVQCGKSFTMSERERLNRIRQGGKEIFCSRRCGGLFTGGGLSENDIKQIKELKTAGKSSYKIAELTGRSRSSVLKYW